MNTVQTFTTTRHRTPMTLVGRHVDSAGRVTMYDAVRGHIHPARIVERGECQVRAQDVEWRETREGENDGSD